MTLFWVPRRVARLLSPLTPRLFLGVGVHDVWGSIVSSVVGLSESRQPRGRQGHFAEIDWSGGRGGGEGSEVVMSTADLCFACIFFSSLLSLPSPSLQSIR